MLGDSARMMQELQKEIKDTNNELFLTQQTL